MQSRLIAAIVAACVLIGGFIGGYAISGGSAPQASSSQPKSGAASTNADLNTADVLARSIPESNGIAAVVHRFPLTAADIKESVESAALAVTDDGRVHLAWASRVAADEWQTFLATSHDRGQTFSTPRVVASSAVHRVTSQSRGKTITREVRMLPRLVSVGNELVLGWVEAVADNTAVKYFIARSSDGGESFSSPVEVSTTDGARPTYTSLTAGPKGEVAASWLDNRRKVQLPAAALSGTGDTFGSDQIAYAPNDGRGVCPCCPTDVAVGADGSLLLAFRNQKDGFRDMWIARLRPGAAEFDAPKPVVTPRWKFDGCPHDGPALVVDQDSLHIAWMDASSGQPRVHLASGSSEAEGFTPKEVAQESRYSQGHPAMVMDDSQRLHLAWDEGSGETSTVAVQSAAHDHPTGHSHEAAAGETERVIQYAVFSPSGDRLQDPVAIAPVAEGFQTRPTVAVHKSGDVYVAWAELTAAGKSIAVARVTRETLASASSDGAGQ